MFLRQIMEREHRQEVQTDVESTKGRGLHTTIPRPARIQCGLVCSSFVAKTSIAQNEEECE